MNDASTAHKSIVFGVEDAIADIDQIDLIAGLHHREYFASVSVWTVLLKFFDAERDELGVLPRCDFRNGLVGLALIVRVSERRQECKCHHEEKM